MGIVEASNWSYGQYVRYSTELSCDGLEKNWYVHFGFWLDCWSNNKQCSKAKLQFGEFHHQVVDNVGAPIRTSGRYMRYCPEMYSNDLTQDSCVRMRGAQI